MARLARRQGQSRLRPPTITGPPVVFRPLSLNNVSPPQPPQYDERRSTHSKLRPPTVVGPAVVFRPLLVSSCSPPAPPPQYDNGRRPHSRLAPPTIISAAVAPFMASPLRVGRVRQDRRYQHVVYRLRPPTVIGGATTFEPVKVRTTRARKPPQTHSLSRTVIYPAGAAVLTQEMGLLTMGAGS